MAAAHSLQVILDPYGSFIPMLNFLQEETEIPIQNISKLYQIFPSLSQHDIEDVMAEIQHFSTYVRSEIGPGLPSPAPPAAGPVPCPCNRGGQRRALQYSRSEPSLRPGATLRSSYSLPHQADLAFPPRAAPGCTAPLQLVMGPSTGA